MITTKNEYINVWTANVSSISLVSEGIRQNEFF